MITGMTGFGASEVAVGKFKALIEIKTVNHRYLDVAFYLPSGFTSFEERIQKIVSKEIKRGRVTVSVKIIEKPHVAVHLNEDAVQQYLDFSKKLSRKLGVKNGLTAADLMRFPGVVEAKEVYIDAQTLW